MLSPAARHNLLVEWNGRPFAHPTVDTTDQLFQHAARTHPDAPAITFAGTTLTYAEFDGKVHALAHRLRDAGVTRGAIVPLIIGDSPELPLSMFALMRLAAAFVPVDPGWPHERIATLIEKLDPPVVLGREPLPELLHLPWLVVAAERLDPTADPVMEPPATADELIYGFYTSGSTGVPKCALNIHGGLLNRFLYMSRRFGTRHTVLQNSRHVFDSSIWQLLWPLTNGGHVVIPQRDGILDLGRTLDAIAEHGVTMTDFVPSIFNTLVDLVSSEPARIASLRSLRRLLIGGEQINAAAVHRFLAIAPHIGVTNTYGPTECSIGSIFHDVRATDDSPIPIGRPIDNTYAVVLDDDMRLVAPGAIGELYLGGQCVGRGYLADPEKTRLAFVPNPFAEIPGDRLYRTGDLAMFRPDGLLHFVGRDDQQVKVNGVRIELTEVESGIAGHPDVREVRVVRRDGTVATLVAFVVAPGLDVRALKEHANAVLPKEVVPARFVLIDRMPLNANGKTDLRQLSALAVNDLADAAPAGPADEMVSVWRELLGHSDVSADTDFFDSGGNSLLAQRLALTLSAHTGRPVSLRDVLTNPTPVAFARFLTGDGTPPEPILDLTAEAYLDPALVAAPGAPARPGHIVLTGATGFVGAHVLSELLSRSAARVTCLVRAENDAEARVRVDAALRYYRLPADDLLERVETRAADLKRSQFGLSNEQFDHLARDVDAVLHCGAKVNMLLDYASHQAVNVGGTRELLRFASHGRAKHVHLVSTLSVLADDNLDGEPAEPDRAAVPTDGYSQSKWVAERLAGLARGRGFTVSIHRLGDVMPHSGTGVASRRGSLPESILRCCAKLGLTFVCNAASDFTPVDHVAQFIATAAIESTGGESFHVLGPTEVRLGDMLAHVGARMGWRTVGIDEFWAALRDAYAKHPDDVDIAQLLALTTDGSGVDPSGLHKFLEACFRDAARTGNAPAAAKFRAEHRLAWPVVDGSVFDTYAEELRHLA